MLRTIAFTVALLAVTPSLAQQPMQAPPDPAFLQKAIASLQAQRNEAQDRLTGAEARIALLADELNKAQTEVARLKSKYESPKPVEPKKE